MSRKGVTQKRQKITVPVPVGIEDGQTVRMPVGNREVFITTEWKRALHKEGGGRVTEAISLAQAALRGSVRVQGISRTPMSRFPGHSEPLQMRMSGKKESKKVSGFGNGDHL